MKIPAPTVYRRADTQPIVQLNADRLPS